jgi:hypothetical protein
MTSSSKMPDRLDFCCHLSIRDCSLGVARGPFPYVPHPSKTCVNRIHNRIDELREELLDQDNAILINDAFDRPELGSCTLPMYFSRSVSVKMHLHTYELLFEPMHIVFPGHVWTLQRNLISACVFLFSCFIQPFKMGLWRIVIWMTCLSSSLSGCRNGSVGQFSPVVIFNERSC